MKPKKQTNPKRIVVIDDAGNGDATCTVVAKVKDGVVTIISEKLEKSRKGVQNR
jgi:hypothetical protein